AAGGWDRQYLEDLSGNAQDINEVHASADGTRVLSVSSNVIALWIEREDGTWGRHLVAFPNSPLPFAALSADGQFVFYNAGPRIEVHAEDENGVWLGEPVAIIEAGEFNNFTEVAVSADGGMVLAADYEGVELWVESARDGYSRVFTDELKDLTSFGFSADGSAFYGDANDKTKVWRITGGDESGLRVWGENDIAAPVLVTAEERTFEREMSADGSVLVTAGFSGPLEIWGMGREALDAGAALRDRRAENHEATAAAFSASGRTLAVSDGDGVISLWRRGTDGAWSAGKATEGLLAREAIAAAGEDLIAAANMEGVMAFGRNTDGTWKQSLLSDESSAWVSVSRDGARIVAESDTLEVSLWTRGADENWTATVLQTEEEESLENASISADGGTIISVGANDLTEWREGEDGKWTPRRIDEAFNGIEQVAFGAGDEFVSAGASGVIKWSPGAGGSWTFERVGPEFYGRRARLSPDGKSIVSLSLEGAAQLWRRRDDGKWTSVTLAAGNKVLDVAFSPDGDEIALATEEGARVIGASWLAGGRGVVEEACRQLGVGGGRLRTLSAKDVEAAPMASAYLGQDVCAWRPQWYDRALDAVLGWMN
ncbi:MAG TPA: WD40 repeat domain-containing protein, partial [Hyphomonadaceae bacterium]